MAKILLGPTVIGIRGTVAGITFSQNRGGPYARGWHTPPNPQTTTQNAQRVKLGNWAKAWMSLSAANQTLWRNYAAAAAQALTDSLGQTYYASGLNWFANVNIVRAQMGLAQLSTAPTIAAPVAPTVPFVRFRTTANPTAGGSTIRVTLGSPTIALYHQLFVAVVNTQARTAYPATNYWMVTQVPNGVGNITFGTQQAAKFGTTVNTQRGFAWLYAVSTEGRCGQPTLITGDFSDVT